MRLRIPARRGLLCALSALPFAGAALLFAGDAAAIPSRPLQALVDQHLRMGQSVGSPTDGHLVGGSRLEPSPYLRMLPAYAAIDARWGLGTLVSLVDRSARAVRRQFPDAVLSVGQLSKRGGGDIERHASHESGRDADLSFYIKNQASHPLYSDHMVSFRGDGTAPSWPGAFFDDARNWALVSAIVQDPHAKVTYIFVAAPLRARLLAYAARTGASQAIRSRAAELMVQPRGSLPHDDHFHVRIACPAGMTGCIELPTRARPARAIARHAAPKPAPGAPAAHAVAPTVVATRVKPTVQVVPESPPAPSTAAVLAVPFDDADGPIDTGLDPKRIDIE